ncbi:hypothetical protein COV15_00565 [Candidatus Woesearchaeota archaeon CG10_big_fil_rev_8_21_14_0_10_34_12]|nr:MAG: hypothetical protein COV15_00565 [Candidatus Woesearchaeota archaeon CG10_big_fil_rev_8_21_14_0_10_34_12]
MKNIINNFDSVSEEIMTNYAGEWIAVGDGKVILHSKSLKDVNSFTKTNYPKKRALIGKITEANLSVLSIC